MRPESHLTLEWREWYAKLPSHIKPLVDQAFQIWREDPGYPSFRQKSYVSPTKGPIYRVHLSHGYRAVARKHGNVYLWFFVGSHAEYESTLGLKK